MRVRETIKAEYRAEPYAGLEPFPFGDTRAASERGLPVVGSAAAKLCTLDELDGVAIRVLEPR